jgi:hypothetical protein
MGQVLRLVIGIGCAIAGSMSKILHERYEGLQQQLEALRGHL